MPFWPTDVEHCLNDEDLSFLKSMKTDRVASMGPLDKILASKEHCRLKRHRKAAGKSSREVKRKKEDQEAFKTWDDPLLSHVSTLEASPSFSPPKKKRTHRRSIKSGVTVFIPHDVLKHPILSSALTRNNITPTVAARTIHCLIEACNGDPSKVNLSYSSATRYLLHISCHP